MRHLSTEKSPGFGGLCVALLIVCHVQAADTISHGVARNSPLSLAQRVDGVSPTIRFSRDNVDGHVRILNDADRLITFEANQGQAASTAKFVTRGPHHAMFLRSDGLTFNFRSRDPQNRGDIVDIVNLNFLALRSWASTAAEHGCSTSMGITYTTRAI